MINCFIWLGMTYLNWMKWKIKFALGKHENKLILLQKKKKNENDNGSNYTILRLQFFVVKVCFIRFACLFLVFCGSFFSGKLTHVIFYLMIFLHKSYLFTSKLITFLKFEPLHSWHSNELAQARREILLMH